MSSFWCLIVGYSSFCGHTMAIMYCYMCTYSTAYCACLRLLFPALCVLEEICIHRLHMCVHHIFPDALYLAVKTVMAHIWTNRHWFCNDGLVILYICKDYRSTDRSSYCDSHNVLKWLFMISRFCERISKLKLLLL
jgi:hypothetical protein